MQDIGHLHSTVFDMEAWPRGNDDYERLGPISAIPPLSTFLWQLQEINTTFHLRGLLGELLATDLSIKKSQNSGRHQIQ